MKGQGSGFKGQVSPLSLWVRAKVRAAAALTLALIFILVPSIAAAHPLGNFTINHYSRVELGPDQLRIRYVLDLAEIPTFQAMPSLDSDGNGAVSEAEKRAFADRQLATLTPNLHLALNGTRVPLRVTSSELELLPGQGGLQTTRIAAWLDSPSAGPLLTEAGKSGNPVRLELRDDNGPGRPGWREMLVRAEGIAVQGTDGAAVPATDVSDELRAYPEEMLAGPLNVRRLSVSAIPLGAVMQEGNVAESADAGSQESASATFSQSLARSGDRFAELITSTTVSPAIVLLALLTAVALGSMHALSPGHGKTIVGAYLVGSRGTASHALFLGVTVTIVHTAGVFALLLVTLFASQYVLPEQVFPWMSLVSGALVLAVGLSLLRQRLISVRSTRPSSITPDRAPLTHHHGFGSHTHAVPGVDGSPVTWRTLLLLGVSGGLLPCPSAVVLGLGAIALDRVLYGLVLITAFSAGLAATLMAIGLVMVYSGRAAGRLRLLEKWEGSDGRSARLVRAARFLPVISSGVVALAGLALTFEAVQQIDPPRLWRESPPFRMLAANGLSLAVGSLAVYLALRRGRPAVQLAHVHEHHVGADVHAHAHDHTHGHNVHAHPHHHGHSHGHGLAGHDHVADGPNVGLQEPAPSRVHTADAGAVTAVLDSVPATTSAAQ